jgi:hypothetical protein
MTAKSILDREYLEMRCRLLDLAAAMDRIDRGSDAVAVTNDPHLSLLRNAVHLLVDGKPERAARMQMHFSDPYSAEWQCELGVLSSAGERRL